MFVTEKLINQNIWQAHLVIADCQTALRPHLFQMTHKLPAAKQLKILQAISTLMLEGVQAIEMILSQFPCIQKRKKVPVPIHP